MFLPPSDAEGAQREVLETIRSHVGKGASQAQRSAHVSSEDAAVHLSRLRESARQLSLTHALVGRMPPQTSTFRGRVGAWIIRKIQRALFWYTPQILEFHRSVDHVVEEFVHVVEELLRAQVQTRALVAETVEIVRLEVRRVEQDMRRLVEQEALTREFDHRSQIVVAANASERVDNVEGRLGDTERRIVSMRRGLVSQEMRLSMLLEQDRKRLDQVDDRQSAVVVGQDLNKMDGTHRTFQDQFRSTREDMKERSRIYLPILKSNGIGSPEMPLLDVGCGLGEWLEILRLEGVCARGVDANRAMIEECRARNLQALESDAIAYLRSLDTKSLGAVTGFYIIEHLPFPYLMDLLDETVRVLKPGGLAVFETPNPGNAVVSIQKFYFEETPRQPLPGSLMRFLAQERGLCRVEILELRARPDAVHVPEAEGTVAERFSQLFYGPQDYAIIGWKA
jgi:2-polyprenyl-3-methyl-5-hydroxy-6-metoxy-1,4-benzoquinol methylase